MSDLEFDFVIVGAGSGGSVAAERLSADGRTTVCVLEAGGSDRRFYVQLPLGYGKTFYDPSINWGDRTEPDAGLAGQADYWPRGKLVGGSGSINAMVWMRGARSDFDEWAAEGNPGWSYADVLPIFKSLETAETGDDHYRGRSGRIHIANISQRVHPLANRFVAAGRELGFPFNPDFNGETQEGVGIYEVNIKDGWRHSPAKAFLRPALKRANVKLMTRMHVHKIVLEGRRAVGVEVVGPGGRQVIRARREVVLCAGAVNTPHLLHLSGIGPAAHLQSIGIPVVHDLPAVGHHLQDHLGINYVYRSKVPTLNEELRPWWGKVLAGLKFFLFKSGPLSLSLNQGGGFARSRPDSAFPDTQLYLQAISTFEAKKGTRPLLTPDPFPGFAIGLSTCKQTSRGSIVARSPDPMVRPMIRANPFGTPEDVRDMLSGVKLLRRFAQTQVMSEVIAEELAPGPQVVSDADLEADFRRRSATVYHPCGTARMGRDATVAAVDHRLRVHGLTGLRILDASVFPSVPSGNTNAPTMMVAAKGAAMALEDAR